MTGPSKFKRRSLRRLHLRQYEFFLTERFLLWKLPTPTMNSRAFTLIELLIVVAIIAILAAIAVPNFLEAQTRAKVARVQADMRSMAVGVESYQVDNNRPPVRHREWNSNLNPRDILYPPYSDTKVFDPAFPTAPVGLHVITTPVAYLSSLPIDVFNNAIKPLMQPDNGQSAVLDYWDSKTVWARRRVFFNAAKQNNVRENGYALLSVGPDGFVGTPSALFYRYPPNPTAVALTDRLFYDPTNGSTSVGNVYRFATGMDQKEFYDPN